MAANHKYYLYVYLIYCILHVSAFYVHHEVQQITVYFDEVIFASVIFNHKKIFIPHSGHRIQNRKAHISERDFKVKNTQPGIRTLSL